LGITYVVIAPPHFKYKFVMQVYIIAAIENHKKLYTDNFYFQKYTFAYKLQIPTYKISFFFTSVVLYMYHKSYFDGTFWQTFF